MAGGTKPKTPVRGHRRKVPTKKRERTRPLVSRQLLILGNHALNRVTLAICIIYGEHVAMKLHGYSETTQNIVQHLVNSIIFDADMEQYDQEESSGLNPRMSNSFAFSSSSSHLSSQSEVDSRTITNTCYFSSHAFNK